MNQYRRGAIALSLIALGAASLFAASVIGVASTRGTLEVNSSSVRGTANIPDGASVRTNETVGQIQLQNGVQVTLDQNSAAEVYSDRIRLSQGASRVAARQDYGVEALGFRVEAANQAAVARVAYDHNRILVTAVDNPVKVSRDGLLVARLTPGATYFFEDGPANQDAAASAGSTSGSAGNTAKNTAKNAVKAGKFGLSTAAKWGLVAGVAGAGTGVGLGLALTGSDASR